MGGDGPVKGASVEAARSPGQTGKGTEGPDGPYDRLPNRHYPTGKKLSLRTPTESGNQPIRAFSLGHLAVNQPITDQYFLNRDWDPRPNHYQAVLTTHPMP